MATRPKVIVARAKVLAGTQSPQHSGRQTNPMRKRTRLNKQIAESTSDLRRQRLVDLQKEIELRLQDSHRIEEQAAEERVVEVIRKKTEVLFQIRPVQG
jgi:hypothetical protein